MALIQSSSTTRLSITRRPAPQTAAAQPTPAPGTLAGQRPHLPCSLQSQPVEQRRGWTRLPKLSSRQRVVSLHAARSEDTSSSGAAKQGVRVGFGPIDLTVPQELYLAVEVGVLLFQLMLVDAAYSGDWSRIGVITPEIELVLQKVVIFILVAHSITAAISGKLAADRGLNPAVSALRGLLFGTLEINRLIQRPGPAGGGRS